MILELKKHQEIPRNFLFNTNKKGLLIYHGLGSGKTLTAISISEFYKSLEVIVITPASLQDNFKKELVKYNVKKINRYTITSFESFHKLLGIDKQTLNLGLFESWKEIELLKKSDLKVIAPNLYNKNISKKELLLKIKPIYDVQQINKTDKTPFFKNKILIIDEVHRLHNNNGKIAKLILNEAKYAEKIILLSGTPIVNHPSDISSLINLLSGNNELPCNKDKFDELFIKETINIEKIPLFTFFGISFFKKTIYKKDYEIINADLFKKKINWLVSFYNKKSKEFFPNVYDHHQAVVMSPLQEQLHCKTEKETLSKEDMEKMNGKIENYKVTNRVNCYLNKTRQISNIVKGDKDQNPQSKYYGLEVSPKILNIIKKLESGDKPILIYSNYLDFGLIPLANLLKVNNSNFELFTGSTDLKKKKEIVENYNKGQLDILLISSSGCEGLDLKHTRQIHIMEPHWNSSKIDQVIGRGVRYKSHIDLPLSERRVDIYHWYSVYKDNKLSADEYLIEISRKKKIINKKFIDLIENTCIEKNLGHVKR
ncbi:Helicase conserved C-terminal domain [seawater metagenome]|uniref:Helicase conserved C-terminal domain n=1 Tax=seawater metagenome TaxID=1561972 RepID=A0A5E8CJY8_9ZZZZ